MYVKFFKRVIDFFISFSALVVLLPLLIMLTLFGSIKMKGNPFFMQERPGLHERIFKLIKFRTMTNEKGKDGNLFSDEVRLNKYGRFLRSTSLDELPELINIIKGDMAIVGPRPLLTKYLPYYSEKQHHRHDVRPGLTGNAQAHGRNGISWDEKFDLDIQYIDNITFIGDIKIIIDTAKSVLRHDGISQEGQATMEDFVDYVKAKQRINE